MYGEIVLCSASCSGLVSLILEKGIWKEQEQGESKKRLGTILAWFAGYIRHVHILQEHIQSSAGNPRKINGWNLKNHSIEKEHHIPSIHFWGFQVKHQTQKTIQSGFQVFVSRKMTNHSSAEALFSDAKIQAISFGIDWRFTLRHFCFHLSEDFYKEVFTWPNPQESWESKVLPPKLSPYNK